MMKDFVKTQESFSRRVSQIDGHTPTLTYLETRSGWWACYVYRMRCECGWSHPAELRTGKNGDVLEAEYRAFNLHMTEEEDVSHTPILIARIHKKRVMNEIWLFHKSHAIPVPYPWDDWTVCVKNSNGWKPRSGNPSLEAATAKATAIAERQVGLARVEWADRDTVGVKAPVATIVTAATKLVVDAKQLKDTPVAIRDHLTLVHEGVTQLNILKQLEIELEERLHDHMDLGL